MRFRHRYVSFVFSKHPLLAPPYCSSPDFPQGRWRVIERRLLFPFGSGGSTAKVSFVKVGVRPENIHIRITGKGLIKVDANEPWIRPCKSEIRQRHLRKLRMDSSSDCGKRCSSSHNVIDDEETRGFSQTSWIEFVGMFQDLISSLADPGILDRRS
jgi:hypothetical protein